MKETGKEIKSLRDEWIQRDVERDKVKKYIGDRERVRERERE
jgi:hypothetical protein